MKDEYVKNSSTEVRKIAKTQEKKETIEMIMSDITAYLAGGEHQYLITQQLTGFKLIFYG